MNVPTISVEWEREQISVATMAPTKVPDQEWRHVDKQGHGHFWEGDKLPTLGWIVTGTTWVGDDYGGDVVEIGEWRCHLCGEVVEPKERSEYGSPFIPGLVTVTVTVNGEAFCLTEAQYAAAVDGWAQILRKVQT